MKIETPQNPFIGMRPFYEEESEKFLGRDNETQILIKFLQEFTFVFLTGKVGVGKTSFLKASLISTLKYKKESYKQTNWHIIYLKPGRKPLHNFLHKLLNKIGFRVTENIPYFYQLIQQGKNYLLASFLNRQFHLWENRLLIIIDNFEELLIHPIDADESASEEIQYFLNLLNFLILKSDLPIHLLVSIRSDFLEDFYKLENTLPVKDFYQLILQNLSEEKIRECIQQFFKESGVSIEPAVTTQIIKDLRFVPYPLPRLQYGLMRLWDEWSLEASGPLNLKDYERISPIHDLISRDGNEILQKLNTEERVIAEQVFKSLIHVDKKGRVVSYPRTLSELKTLVGDNNNTLEKIIDLFYSGGRTFLRIYQESPSDELWVEIAHVCLTDLWDTYQKWVREEIHAYNTFYYYIQPAIEKPGPLLLVSKKELKQVKQWYEKYSIIKQILITQEIKLDRIEGSFIKRNYKTHGLFHFMWNENGNLVIKNIAWFVLFFTLIVFTGKFLIYQPLSRLYLHDSFSNSTASSLSSTQGPHNYTTFKPEFRESVVFDSSQLRTENKIISSLLSSENEQKPVVKKHIPLTSTPDTSHQKESSGNIIEDKVKKSLENRIQRLWQFGEKALSNRDWLITAHIFAFLANQPIPEKQKIQSYNNLYQSLYTAFLANQFQLPFLPQNLAIANQKPYVVIWNNTNIFQVWNYLSGQQISPNFNFGASIWEIKFAPNDRSFVIWGESKSLKLITLHDSQYYSRKLTHSNFIASVYFSPEGSFLLSSDISGNVKIWDAKTGIQVTGTFFHGEPIQKILFSPDERYFISLTFSGKIYLWKIDNSRSPVKILSFDSDIKKYEGIGYSSAWNHFIAWTNWEVEIRDFNTGRLIRNPYLSTYGLIAGVKISPDLNNILIWDKYRYARIWNLQSNRELNPPLLHQSNVIRADYSSDGKRILTQSSKGRIHIWDSSTHRELINPIFIPGGIKKVQWINNDRLILTNDNQGITQFWDTFTGEPVGFSLPHSGRTSIKLANSQNFLITWSKTDISVKIWNISDYSRNYTQTLEKTKSTIADLDFPAKYLQLLVEVVTGTTLDNNGNILILSPQQWEKKKVTYEQIAKNHLNQCRYKNINFYIYQKRIWDKWKVLSYFPGQN